MFQLTGKVAVVTGGGSGIGAAIATLFARQQARVVVLDVDADAARRTADAITAGGHLADAKGCDVSNSARVTEVVAAIAAAHPRIDILVNNAGIAHVGTIEQTTEADWTGYQVNVKACSCARARRADHARTQGGGVI